MLGEHLSGVAAATPDALAVVDGDVRLTYGELDERVARMAAALVAMGVGPGEVVARQLPNWWEAHVVHHGAIRAGAVSNPLMPILRERDLRFMLRQAQSRGARRRPRVPRLRLRGDGRGLQAELDDLERVLVARPAGEDPDPLAAVLEGSDGAPVPDGHARRPDDPCLLLYTSGTEAEPKGAVHSHNTLGYEIESMIELYGLGGDDVVLMVSPLPHITGVAYGLHLPPVLGAPVVMQRCLRARRRVELIEREGCSFTIAATPFLHMLTHHPDRATRDVGALRVFGCGGADVSPTLVREATEALGACIVRLYGSTEFPTVSCGTCDEPLDRRAEFDGRAVAADGDPGDRRGRRGHRARRRGRVSSCLAAPSCSWATRTWTAGGRRRRLVRTGDLGVVDDAGYVCITGRRKDVVMRGGENISVKEIEDLLLDHAAVEEIAIVAMPDPVMVERCCAYVVPAGDAVPELGELCEHLLGHQITKQKLPERLEVVEALPRTASGKIQKFALREMIAAKLEEERA